MSRYSGVPSKISKCTFPYSGVRKNACNLHFATVSRNRPTESCERVHPIKAKYAFRYSGAQSKNSTCTFCYSGVRKNVYNKAYNNRRLTTILDVRPVKNYEMLRRHTNKYDVHHSFERPTSTK